MDLVKSFEGEHVRVLVQDDKVFFQASHVARVLDIKNIHSSLTSILGHVDKEDMELYRTTLVTDTVGGSQEAIFLTEKGVYHVLFRSKKPIAIHFQDWVCDVLKSIRQTGQYKLEDRVKVLEEQNNLLQQKLKPTATYLYAFKTDRYENDADCEIKFGMSSDVDERKRNFLTNAPHTIQVAAEHVPKQYALIAEKKILLQLMKMTGKVVNSEVYRTSVEEAKATVQIVTDLVNLYSDQSKEGFQRRSRVLGRLVILLNETLRDDPISSETQLSVSELSQVRDCLKQLTSLQVSTPESSVIQKPSAEEPPTNDFDEFVSECCNIGDDLRDDTVTIVGRHRLWTGFTNQEVKSQVHAYLKKRFVACVFVENGRKHHGFEGVKVKHQNIPVSPVPTQAEKFVFDCCTHCPASRLYDTDITLAFSKWRKRQDNTYILSNAEIKELHKYLSSHPHLFLRAVLWMPEHKRSDKGYYGVCLKGDEERFFTHMPPITACKIVGKDPKTGIVQKEWSSVSNAAAALGLSTASLGRSAKNKKLRDGLLIEYKDRP